MEAELRSTAARMRITLYTRGIVRSLLTMMSEWLYVRHSILSNREQHMENTHTLT